MTRDNIVGTLHGDDHVQGVLSVGGVSSYNDLEDLPTLNGETITGNMSIWQPKNFSTSEQNTGLKWIDGSDIYQKSYSLQLSGSTLNIDISDLNAKHAWILFGYYDIGVTDLALNEVISNLSTYTHINTGLTPPYIDCHNTISSNSTINITIQYIKNN